MYPTKFSDQEFIAWCESHKKLLHHTMQCKLDLAKLPLGLYEAISYAVFSPGKRLRPLLCFATGHSLQIAPEKTVEIATALEYMHAYSDLNLKMTSGIYGSTFYMLTGFHGFHVTLGAIMLTVIMFRCMKGHFSGDNHFGFEAVAWYWHFVDVVWLGLFVFVYWL